MKNDKRALRRLHSRRMKKKAKRIYFWNDNPEKYADNLAVCSCPMCGNPRKHFHQETLQEKRADDEFKEEIEEI